MLSDTWNWDQVDWRANGVHWWDDYKPKKRRTKKRGEYNVNVTASVGTNFNVCDPDEEVESAVFEGREDRAELAYQIDKAKLQQFNPVTVGIMQARFRCLWGVPESESESPFEFVKAMQRTKYFSVPQFLKDFLYHVAGGGGSILSYPVCRIFETHHAACGRGFWMDQSPQGVEGGAVFFMIGNMLAFCVLGLNGLFFYLRTVHPEQIPTLGEGQSF